MAAQGVGGDLAAGRRKAEACAACHGPGGNSSRPDTPSLAGQLPLYTYYQLIHYRRERRRDPQMTPVAANLTDDDMRDLAAYFAAQAPAPPSGATIDPAKASAGQRLSVAHFCESCHVPGFVGQQQVPRLTGLPYDYLVRQLRAYKTQTRADLDLAMITAAQALTEQDIEDLAHYILAVAGARRTP